MSVGLSCYSLEYKRRYNEQNKERIRLLQAEWADRNNELLLWRGAKKRAKKYNVPFTIEVEDIVIPEICPVLGIKLARVRGRIQDYSPTVDRVIPERGYTKDNIRIISFRANRLKCDGTLAELKAVVKYVEENTNEFS